MSSIAFHTKEKTVYVLGSERAYMGVLVNDLALAIIAPRIFEDELKLVLPKGSYLQEFSYRKFESNFAVWFSAFGEKFVDHKGNDVDPFVIALNTVLRMGNDVIKLMVRLHGQCEIHAYVRPENKRWLYDIILDGLKLGLLRPDQGWESVMALIGNDGPIVTSYSVTEGFPNSYIAEYDPDEFYELPYDRQWDLAWDKLSSDGGLEISPKKLGDYFEDGEWAGTLMDEAAMIKENFKGDLE